MPLYLDRHDGIDASPEDLAAAHVADVAVESQHGVHYHTYWFDPSTKSVFCLAEGPSREAIEAVHRDSHGLMADVVIELDQATPLNSFFGQMPQHPVGEAYTASAVRAIVFTDMIGSVEQVHNHGEEVHLRLLDEHDEIVRGALSEHDGREIKHTGDGIMAAFTSVTAAVRFSIATLHRLNERSTNDHEPQLEISLGMSAGEPVTRGNEDLFGAVVQVAARLCAAAKSGEVLVSAAVREMCAGKGFKFADRGEFELKGVPEPTRAYALEWQSL